MAGRPHPSLEAEPPGPSAQKEDGMSAAITAEDEVFHPFGHDPWWNESAWYSFNVPERDINGFVYFYYNARLRLAGGGPAVWDPSGDQMYDCLFCDWDWFQPVPDGLVYENFTLPSSLSQEMVSPLTTYRLAYSRRGCELDLEWHAAMPAQPSSMSQLEPAGVRHFDQPGSMRGEVRIGGDALPIDCYSLRDHTWGPQRFDQLQPGDYFWAVASPEENWHAITIQSAGGGPEHVVDGYLVREGVVAPLVRGTRRVVEREGGRPRRVQFEAVDAQGRRLEAEGRTRNALHFAGWPGQFTYFCLTSWQWDGKAGLGEDQEFFPLTRMRALVSSAV
jgi:hypothetical protein